MNNRIIPAAAFVMCLMLASVQHMTVEFMMFIKACIHGVPATWLDLFLPEKHDAYACFDSAVLHHQLPSRWHPGHQEQSKVELRTSVKLHVQGQA